MIRTLRTGWSEFSLREELNLLRKWRQALEAVGDRAPPEKREQTVLEEENRRLRTENERLRMEREILKKATVFFAKESR